MSSTSQRNWTSYERRIQRKEYGTKEKFNKVSLLKSKIVRTSTSPFIVFFFTFYLI